MFLSALSCVFISFLFADFLYISIILRLWAESFLFLSALSCAFISFLFADFLYLQMPNFKVTNDATRSPRALKGFFLDSDLALFHGNVTQVAKENRPIVKSSVCHIFFPSGISAMSFALLKNITQVGEEYAIPSNRQFSTTSFPGASQLCLPTMQTEDSWVDYCL